MAALRTQEIEKLIELVGADVYRFCLRMTQCQADAEDLYQQTRDLLLYNRRRLAEREIQAEKRAGRMIGL